MACSLCSCFVISPSPSFGVLPPPLSLPLSLSLSWLGSSWYPSSRRGMGLPGFCSILEGMLAARVKASSRSPRSTVALSLLLGDLRAGASLACLLDMTMSLGPLLALSCKLSPCTVALNFFFSSLLVVPSSNVTWEDSLPVHVLGLLICCARLPLSLRSCSSTPAPPAPSPAPVFNARRIASSFLSYILNCLDRKSLMSSEAAPSAGVSLACSFCSDSWGGARCRPESSSMSRMICFNTMKTGDI
mmetsp:Transcript_6727/g.15518  ORF Transcript_6727/g.15518 Transcript_6727/m.15518 type:complete len:245 (-) Transcript_6727:1730-2464(-)